MKQILIITRITGSETKDEFRCEFYNDLKEDVKVDFQEGHFEADFEDLHLDIYSGVKLYNDKAANVAKNIRSKIDPKADEVLIVIHSLEFEKVKSELINLRDGANWQIKEYSSSKGPINYDDIKRAFREILADPSEVETIRKLFSNDSILEARLELLHTCIIPGNIPAEEGLDSSLLAAFRSFKASVEEIRKNKTDELTWENKDYIEALTRLRISLLGS